LKLVKTPIFGVAFGLELLEKDFVLGGVGAGFIFSSFIFGV
jgi:hypothetical protein